MATYRFVRWDVTVRKDPASSMQAGEFQVRNSGGPVGWPFGTTVTSPYHGCPTTETPANLIDGTNSKFLDFGFRCQSTIQFAFPSYEVSPTFDAYRFRTADNRPESDPVSWVLEGSFDGSNFHLLDSRELYDPIPTARTTLTDEFDLPEPVRWKYLRWRIFHVRQLGADGLSAFVDRITASEFELLSNGSPVTWPGSTVVSNPSGANPSGEGPGNLIDGSSSTRWADTNAKTNADAQSLGLTRMIFDCGSGNSVTFDSYRWLTALDSEPRDPQGWSVYGSNDGTSWDLLDTRNEVVTSSRNTYTSEYPIGEVEATTGEKYAIIGTQGFRHPKRTGNLLAEGFEGGISGWVTDDTDEVGFSRIDESSFLLRVRTGLSLALLWNEATPITAYVESPKVSVSEGQMIEATLWVRRQSAHGLIQACQLGISWYTNSGFLHGTNNGASLKIPNGNTWFPIRVSQSVPIGFGVTQAALRVTHIWPNGGDQLFLDDPFLGLSAADTTFEGGSPSSGSLTAVAPAATGAFTGDVPTVGAFDASGAAAHASFTAEHEGALLVAVAPASSASFAGETTAPNEAAMGAVAAGAVADLTGDPARPEIRVQPVDVRPRRGRLQSRVFPVRWRDG